LGQKQTIERIMVRRLDLGHGRGVTDRDVEGTKPGGGNAFTRTTFP
jgi:hypothetical protein